MKYESVFYWLSGSLHGTCFKKFVYYLNKGKNTLEGSEIILDIDTGLRVSAEKLLFHVQHKWLI
jgi:hypothetical protein